MADLHPNPTAILQSIQVGKPRAMGREGAAEWYDQPWMSGFHKQPINGTIMLRRLNLDGDGQADLKNHGGADKAVNVYPIEHYTYWKRVLDAAEISGGAFGENFTVSGMTERDVHIGDVYQIGEARVQVSQPRQPCWKLSRRWRVKDLALQVVATGYTGWYLRVLREGQIRAGHALELLDRPHPSWTVDAANQVMHHDKENLDAAKRLATCAALSEAWRGSLEMRISKLQST